MLTKLKKRDGTLEEFSPDKLNKWGEWSAGMGVDWSSIVLGACRKVQDGCTSDELHDALISECIDRETTPHLKMAGRLYIGRIWKRAFGDWKLIPTVREMYHGMIFKGLWEPMDYSDEELDLCETFIEHGLDKEATLTETKQIIDKYAIVDRIDKKVYESPQFVYMRMALGVMKDMPKDRRMKDVERMYYFYSRKKINPPTPAFINLGTPKRQYASCCTFTTLDTLPSLAAADHIAYIMTGASAGIGSNIVTRSLGDKVRGGAIVHQGKIPYYRMQEAAVSANKQGSRGGANTMHFHVLDPEIEALLKLKNVQTVKSKQVKDIDYSVGANELFCQKAARNESWMLISYGDAPDLWDAAYDGDQSKFNTLYALYEQDSNTRKTFVSARGLAKEFLTEGVGTGREYQHFTDEMNRHTPFKERINLSNLCQEIGLVTRGYGSVAELYKTWYDEGDGEIGLCSLSAIAANVEDDEFEECAYYAALSIDNIIEISDYPFPQLAVTAKARRSIGVGITNLAYTMAKNGMKYSTLEGKQFIHRLAERHSFYLHKASVRLAKERGACEWMHKTHYNEGWLPIDTANREIDLVVNQPLAYNWEQLRQEVLEFGVRFSVLEAHMPCESSSVASGHTNGLYPIRDYKVVKTSGTNKNLFIAPEYETLPYELAWDIPPMDMIEVYAIVQKFTGQSISADEYHAFDPENRSIGFKQLLKEYLYKKKLGVKTRYYYNSRTRSSVQRYEEVVPDCAACSL